MFLQISNGQNYELTRSSFLGSENVSGQSDENEYKKSTRQDLSLSFHIYNSFKLLK